MRHLIAAASLSLALSLVAATAPAAEGHWATLDAPPTRVALLPIPGTAATATGALMTIEAIEIKGIKSGTRSFFVPDPQGFWLEFMDHDVKKDPVAK